MQKNDGIIIDDTPRLLVPFTDEEWSKIQELLSAGKEEEAQKLIESIERARPSAE